MKCFLKYKTQNIFKKQQTQRNSLFRKHPTLSYINILRKYVFTFSSTVANLLTLKKKKKKKRCSRMELSHPNHAYILFRSEMIMWLLQQEIGFLGRLATLSPPLRVAVWPYLKNKKIYFFYK